MFSLLISLQLPLQTDHVEGLQAGPTPLLHNLTKIMSTATGCKSKHTNEHLLQLAIQGYQAISQVKTLCEQH